MARPIGTHFVVSASLLGSGAPCYRRRDGGWSTDLQEAHAVAGESERDALLASAAGEPTLIADPYAFPVRLDGERIDPMTAREQIRAKGPSVAYRRPDPLPAGSRENP